MRLGAINVRFNSWMSFPLGKWHKNTDENMLVLKLWYVGKL